MPQIYTENQKSIILQKLYSKIQFEFMQASDDNEKLNELMEKYGIVLEDNAMWINLKDSKILIVGALAGKKNDFITCAKKSGINERNLEFFSDYEKLTNLGLAKLEYSNKYSDIIFGPVPHSMVGKNDSTSIIAKMESEPSKYPRVTRAKTENEIKLSISSFKKAITCTRYYESLCNS